jgi:hypothetical protein
MGSITPRKFAGHGMPCPYKTGWIRGEYCILAPRARIEREPVRIREAGGVALPVGEGRDVVRFAGHLSFRIVAEGALPGNGPHRFEFVGRTPLIVWALVVLLFANTFLGLALMVFHPVVYLPPNDRGLHKYATTAIVWNAEHWNAVQFALLALLGVMFLIYRKNVRYVDRGPKQSE